MKQIARILTTAAIVPLTASATAAAKQPKETAVLAGGCFWGMEGVFEHVKGVTDVTSGYAGGSAKDANYDHVSSERTGHAEAVRIRFDPRQISYGRLLQIFFSVAHDPTQLNRQGPDAGPQYRSAIFPANQERAKIAKAYIEQLDAAGVYKYRIVTTIESGRTFYPAETYHQDYMTRHPRDPYIMVNDLPKVADLKRLFPQRYRSEPVLVRGS